MDMPLLNQVDEKKKKLDQKRPFSSHTVKTIREHLIVEWTYHSNAIEGNTLTLSETKVVLEGITVGGKTLREHLEVINHREAIFYLEDMVRNKEQLSEWHIKNLHGIVLKGIDQNNAGTYRRENVLISGARHIPPDVLQVPEQMREMMEWYQGEAQELHPIVRAAMLHSIFVKIHPFIDGNGRTARLLLNLELMKSGYVPIVIQKENRLDYYKALDELHVTEDYSDFVQLVVSILDETLDFYFRIVK